VSLPVVLLADAVFHLAQPTKLLALAGISVVSNVLTLLWLRRRAGRARWPTLRLRGPQEQWGWYALLPLLLLAQGVLVSPLHFLHLPNWTSNLFRDMATNKPLILLFGCVAAPVLEEVLFRGILLQGLLRNYRPAVAIGQSALLFGVIHFNPAQSVNAALLGLLLGWLYYQTRSLGLCIGLHALNNLLVFSAMSSRRLENAPELSQVTSIGWYLVMLVAAAGLLAGCLWWLRRLAASPATERSVLID
ncbi:MAG: CPBP family intramembrane metalloprotease, partial [Hymenobacter sp.]